MPDNTNRGDLSRQQKDQLLEAVNPNRILQANGHSHLSQQDVRAHLIRIFDFGHFDIEVVQTENVFEESRAKSPQDAMLVWEVCYRAQVRLTLRNESQQLVAILEDGATATSEGMRSRGGAHDVAYKSAISLAIKRAATSLGDQFGLSLYNKGQRSALVKMTLESQSRAGSTGDVQQGIEQQTDLGLEYSEGISAEGSQEPAAPSAKPPATKQATKGRQGTRRPAAAAPAPAEPEPTPEAAPAAPEPATAPPAPDEPAAPSVDDAEAAEAAERARIAFEQQAKVEAEDAAAEAANPAPAAPREETADEVAERIKAERAARGANATPVAETKPKAEAQAIVQAEPEPWAGDPRDWKARMAAARDLATLKQVWDDATAVREMTTELRAAISRRKAEIQRELAAPPAPEGDTPGVLDGSI